MDYKVEDKNLIEASNRYKYYSFNKKDIERIVKQNIKEVSEDDWRTLIQMLYPNKMIGSGLFQPILIFKIGRNGKRIDPPIEAYNSLDDLKDGTCLLFRIIDYIEKNSQLKINSSWYKHQSKILEVGEKK